MGRPHPRSGFLRCALWSTCERTLYEEVNFDATGVKSVDWVSYLVLRFQDVPVYKIQLINRLELPAIGAAEAHRGGSSGHRQRRVRCDRVAPARNPIYPGARP
jgi:hypothetical protein